MSHFKGTMHHIRFRRGYAPRPAGGAFIALQTPSLYLRGPTSKGRKGEGKGGVERPYAPHVANSWLRHCLCWQGTFRRPTFTTNELITGSILAYVMPAGIRDKNNTTTSCTSSENRLLIKCFSIA